MTKKLGSTCAECPSNCCTFGNGSRILKVGKFLEDYMTTSTINARCENLTKAHKCKVWGTPQLPVECRSHVCHCRSFTEAEIKLIDSIDPDRQCTLCGTQWVMTEWQGKKFVERCEVCGDEFVWEVAKHTNGNEKFKKRRKKK